MNFSGIAAALMTSVLWSMSSIFFTIGGRQLGSVMVNRVRLFFAVTWLMVSHLIMFGSPVPLGTPPEKWFWFGISGIVGLAIGDAFLFKGYLLVGPRITTLFMATVPVISTVFGLVFFNEVLKPLELVAIAITISGIIIVVLHGNGRFSAAGNQRDYLLGIGCGLGAAVGQATGMALAKNGLTGDFNSLSGTVIRMLAAFIVIWLVAAFSGKVRATIQTSWQQKVGLRAVLLGSIVGPFLGVWTSMIAMQSEVLGIAATLMSLQPILVLPIVHFVFKEKISTRDIFGTAIAIIGIALLLLTRAGFFS